MAPRVLAAVVCAALLVACGRGTPPPRDSSRLVAVTPDPPGWRFAFAAIDRSTWAYRAADYTDDALLLDTPGGSVDGARGPGLSAADVAADGTIVLCDGDAIRTRDGGSWTESSPTDVAGIDGYGCWSAAAYDGGDLWLLLANSGAFYGEPTGPDLLCHVTRAGPACRALPGRISSSSLARTEGRLWWAVDDELFAIDRADAAEPFVVAPLETWRDLQGSAGDESVLAWRSGTGEDPEIIALDGTTTRYVSAPESGTYRDVWLGPGGRVLAAELLHGGGGGGSSGGLFGYSGGSSGGSYHPWTQLVVWELGAGAPVELGHADLDADLGEPVGLARGETAMVASTGELYAIPL